MVTLLTEFCDRQMPPVVVMSQITPMLLEQWRSTWTFKADSASPAVHDQTIRSFFKWALRMRVIQDDPYEQLDRFESHDPVTLPFSPAEVQRILDAISEVGYTAEEQFRLRGLMLAERWGGLSLAAGAANGHGLSLHHDLGAGHQLFGYRA